MAFIYTSQGSGEPPGNYNVIEHAQRYVAAMPAAISGQGGHNQTYAVACVLIQGFGLSTQEAWHLLVEYNQRCQPAWTEKELWHKLEQAQKADPPADGKGSMAKGSSTTDSSYHPVQEAYQFESFMTACFKPDDIVSIAPGFVPEGSERAVPEHSGVNLFTRDQWIQKCKESSGIHRVFSSKDGLYVRINPVQLRSNGTDKSVTSLRHTLIESDKMQKEDQLRILKTSGLPISALIDSGGNSIHAWVKVEAQNLQQYHERREKLWASLKGFEIDQANKNPSRYSRCPGGLRVSGTQKLLAINIGPKSYTEWDAKQSEGSVEHALTPSMLNSYCVKDDPNTVLGNRWLCKGGSLLIVGQSGIGKSTFAMQLAILWALQKDAFGITPKRPLRSLFIQAENDMGDLSEMFQGVCRGMGLSSKLLQQIEDKLIFYRDTIHCGPSFAKYAEQLVEKHQPDLVWVDPLLNYIGDDASQQKVVSEFCARLLNPISQKTGVIWCIMHHTGKPTSDPNSKSHWTGTDLAYSGLGSSILTNWAREVAVLTRLKMSEGYSPRFRFTLCKRRKRAGMTELNGEVSESIYLRHSHEGLCWIQCNEPDQEQTDFDKPAKKGRRSLEIEIPEFEQMSTLSRQLREQLAKKYSVSVSTIERRWRNFKPNSLDLQ